MGYSVFGITFTIHGKDVLVSYHAFACPRFGAVQRYGRSRSFAFIRVRNVVLAANGKQNIMFVKIFYYSVHVQDVIL